MSLGDWFGQLGQNVGNNAIDKINDSLGGPVLPPIRKVDPYTNPNAYVYPREPQGAPEPLGQPKVVDYKKYALYGGIAVGVVLVIALVMKKR